MAALFCLADIMVTFAIFYGDVLLITFRISTYISDAEVSYYMTFLGFYCFEILFLLENHKEKTLLKALDFDLWAQVTERSRPLTI